MFRDKPYNFGDVYKILTLLTLEFLIDQYQDDQQSFDSWGRRNVSNCKKKKKKLRRLRTAVLRDQDESLAGGVSVGSHFQMLSGVEQLRSLTAQKFNNQEV